MTIEVDKVLHALAGATIAGVVYPFGVLAAVAALFVIGAAKELVYDKLMGKGTPSVLDAAYTIWTGVLVLGWLELAAYYLK